MSNASIARQIGVSEGIVIRRFFNRKRYYRYESGAEF